MMYITGLFKRVEHITEERMKSVSSMTPRNKEYSNDLRELVNKPLLRGDSEREIANKVLILRDSVHYIIAEYKLTKSIGNLRVFVKDSNTLEHPQIRNSYHAQVEPSHLVLRTPKIVKHKSNRPM